MGGFGHCYSFRRVVWQRLLVVARMSVASRRKIHSEADDETVDEDGKVGLATLSPDGKLFAYTADDLGQKSLGLGTSMAGITLNCNLLPR